MLDERRESALCVCVSLNIESVLKLTLSRNVVKFFCFDASVTSVALCAYGSGPQPLYIPDINSFVNIQRVNRAGPMDELIRRLHSGVNG